MKLCGACGAEDATTECNVCGTAYYCNVKCQLDALDLHREYDCTGGSCTTTPREAPQAKDDGGGKGGKVRDGVERMA
jgi:hypothetical protein